MEGSATLWHLVFRSTNFACPLRVNALHCRLVQYVCGLDRSHGDVFALGLILKGLTMPDRTVIKHTCDHAPVSITRQGLVEVIRNKAAYCARCTYTLPGTLMSFSRGL